MWKDRTHAGGEGMGGVRLEPDLKSFFHSKESNCGKMSTSVKSEQYLYIRYRFLCAIEHNNTSSSSNVMDLYTQKRLETTGEKGGK